MKKILLGLLALLSSVFGADISTYEYATYQDTPSTKNALATNGFTIVGEYDAMQDPNYHVIVYTCPTLKKGASTKDRGFAGVQKVLVDTTNNTLVLTNPEYFLSAYLQDDFNADNAKRINSKLTKTFGELKGSEDTLEDDDIAGYHFMMGMPYYEDMIEVAQGDDLLAKLQKNAGDNVVFTLQVGDATVVGVAMPTENGEKSYISAIKGEKHTAFLPYMVLIQGDEAKIMHPKYALAIAYPKLSMGDFMGISGTPGDIEDYFTSLFK